MCERGERQYRPRGILLFVLMDHPGQHCVFRWLLDREYRYLEGNLERCGLGREEGRGEMEGWRRREGEEAGVCHDINGMENFRRRRTT